MSKVGYVKQFWWVIMSDFKIERARSALRSYQLPLQIATGHIEKFC